MFTWLWNTIEFIQRHPLPAMCMGAPDVYVLAKKDTDSMSIGLWNVFPDEIMRPEILLDDKYAFVDFYHTQGHLEGNKVILDEPLRAYDFAFVTVRNKEADAM